MDLIEAIVTYYQTATDEATSATRTLLEGSSAVLAPGQGKMFADYDEQTATPPPYVAVSDHQGSRTLYVAFDNETRVDEYPIQFAVFAKTRTAVVEILDQLQAVYQNTQLQTDDWVVIGAPYIELRRTFWGLDEWGGLLELYFTCQS